MPLPLAGGLERSCEATPAPFRPVPDVPGWGLEEDDAEGLAEAAAFWPAAAAAAVGAGFPPGLVLERLLAGRLR